MIHPPSTGYLRWLGAFLDNKLSWKLHTQVMNERGTTILSGMKLLGNTIRGLSQTNRRTIVNACIEPVLTYCAPLWYRPDKPQLHLIRKLETIHHAAIRWVLGVFRTTPTIALNVLANIPPLHLTIEKLAKGYNLRMFRLPLTSPVIRRIPVPYVPPKARAKQKHIPFARPLVPKPTTKPSKITNLQYLATRLPPETERTYPFIDANAPWAPDINTYPFAGRLSISSDPPPRKEQKSLATAHNIQWYQSEFQPHTLIIHTDGSRHLANDSSADYGVIGVYLGQVIFTQSIYMGKRLLSYDAEMSALAHGALFASKFIPTHPTVSRVLFYSDSSSALKTIMDGGPHASQFSSVLFRHKMYKLLKDHPTLHVHMNWTPGHRGVLGNKLADKAARRGSKNKGNTEPLLSHTSKSFHKEMAKAELKNSWKREFRGNLPRPSSGFADAAKVLIPRTKPSKTEKEIPLELKGRLNQVLTGHGYFGEYYKRMNIPDREYDCVCTNEPKTLESRTHIIKECPHYGRRILERAFPRLHHFNFSLSSLFRRENHALMAAWLRRSGAFTKLGAPWENLPTNPHDPGPSSAVIEVYPADNDDHSSDSSSYTEE